MPPGEHCPKCGAPRQSQLWRVAERYTHVPPLPVDWRMRIATPSYADFLDTIRKSGLLPDAQLTAAIEEYERAAARRDSRALAGALVSEGVLTRWQSENLLAGCHKGFRVAQYTVLDWLGRGTLGNAFVATNLALSGRFSFKAFQRFPRDATELSWLQGTLRCVSQLSGEHRASILDAGRGADKNYVVRQFIEGASLWEIVESAHSLELVEAVKIAAQLALGVAEAHEAGHAYLSLNPHNVIVSTDGIVRVTTIGIPPNMKLRVRRRFDGRSFDARPFGSRLNATSAKTALYQADVLSIGSILYYLLAARPPDRRAMTLSVTAGSADYSKSSVAEAIYRRTRAAEPEDRFSSARELADDLVSWLESS